MEHALAQGQSQCLLAMATGTGKTRTIIGLMYRFLKAERFRRILFLVDRTALGDQAQDAFNEAPLEGGMPLSKIYNVAELGDMAAEAGNPRAGGHRAGHGAPHFLPAMHRPLLDAFDCIIVDEAHRGYTLDQDMTEGEQALRDPAQYLSSYRRVLDYFDAVKIGLTATPAKHTTDIFGKPVYTYSYREAVADDWLIDHEPPIRYETLLSRHGIHFDKGQQVEALNLSTGEVESAELEDELHFELESFNRRVINEDFNRVICQQLAQELDPMGEEKTLIFCATDAHADMVKRLLGQAFADLYGDSYNQAAVEKITGASDKVDQLIRRYKNERFPSIAITVDLLTTGIDVPAISHLVFMRRVKSRILYEQMIGRATRRCDAIGKTVFKIYDPVDLYATLQAVNTMQPLVKDPKVTVEQLLDELNHPTAYTTPGSGPGRTHADDVLDQLGQKVMRVLRDAEHKADKKPALRERLAQLQEQWGVPPRNCTATCTSWAKNKAPPQRQTFCAATPAWCSNWPKCANCWAPPTCPCCQATRMNWWPASKAGAATPSLRTTWTASPPLCASSSTSRPRCRWWSTAPKTSPAHSSKKCACCWTKRATPKPSSKPPGATKATRTLPPASWPTSARPPWARRWCRLTSACKPPCKPSASPAPGRPCNCAG